jgi:hypothetical protein
MAHTSAKAKGRKGSAPVAVVPHTVMNHADYVALSPNARSLLFEMARQYNGHNNNGDLTAAWNVMRHRGFRSPTTLANALAELIGGGFLVRTREGRFLNPGKRCALYALTWKPIDECRGKDLDTGPTLQPARIFSAAIIKTPATETVSTRYRNCTDEGEKHA